MKCKDCLYVKLLHPHSKEVAYCTAPAGRRKRNMAIKVNHIVSRDCELFKVIGEH